MGLRQAINDKCKDCIYDELAPGRWRMQVLHCTVTPCPLYPVRPVPDAKWMQGHAVDTPDLPVEPPVKAA